MEHKAPQHTPWIGGMLVSQAELTAQVEALPLDVVRHVLFKAGDTSLGCDGGHFVTALLATIDRADSRNRHKLAVVFPEYVAGWLAAKDEGGHDLLRRRARDAAVLS